MDTSPEYIKMCKKAVEVQIEHDFCDGDFVVTCDGITYVYGDWQGAMIIGFLETSGGRLHSFNCGYEYETDFISKKSDVTWLPRQDQLQKMIKSNNSYMLHKAFVEWMDENQDEQWLLKMRFSGEQLWLAFVMHEKFNKFWNGKDWIVEHLEAEEA